MTLNLHTPFLDSAVGKTVKQVIRVGLSAMIAKLLGLASDPTTFGAFTTVIASALMLAEKALDPETPTLPK